MLKVPDFIQLPEQKSTFPVSASHHCAHTPNRVAKGFPDDADKPNSTLLACRHRRATVAHTLRSEPEFHLERTKS